MLDDNHTLALPDTQASPESRNLVVERAGISGLKYPLKLVDVDQSEQHTVVVADAGVRVASHERGTHMSRLVETVQALGPTLPLATLREVHGQMLRHLGSSAGSLTLRFPWFIDKVAPSSGRASRLDIEVMYCVEGSDALSTLSQRLRVPVTTLCPCSKAISRYGAHNQRSYVTIQMQASQPIAIADVVEALEAQASCAVYPLLKRVDEKFVTEFAFEHPKFAEDLVRDIHQAIASRYVTTRLSVATENQESIHNHAAYAYIGDDPR